MEQRRLNLAFKCEKVTFLILQVKCKALQKIMKHMRNTENDLVLVKSSVLYYINHHHHHVLDRTIPADRSNRQ